MWRAAAPSHPHRVCQEDPWSRPLVAPPTNDPAQIQHLKCQTASFLCHSVRALYLRSDAISTLRSWQPPSGGCTTMVASVCVRIRLIMSPPYATLGFTALC